MARNEKLTVAEALAQAQLIDESLAAWEQTAPRFVQDVGGRDALARLCEMTCIGPVPRLETEAWERVSAEHLERWEASAHKRRAYAPPPTPAPVLPGNAAPQPAKRSRWGFFSR